MGRRNQRGIKAKLFPGSLICVKKKNKTLAQPSDVIGTAASIVTLPTSYVKVYIVANYW